MGFTSTENGKYAEICIYCGNLLGTDLLCSNPECPSNSFTEGNRVSVFGHPEYGIGIIDSKASESDMFSFFGDDISRIDKQGPVTADLGLKYTENDNGAPIGSGRFDFFRIKFGYYRNRIFPGYMLRHYIFPIGARVKTPDGIGTVISASPISRTPLIGYTVKLDDGNTVFVKEFKIKGLVETPLKALLSDNICRPSEFILGYCAELLHCAYISNTVKTVRFGRLKLMPHQVFVAYELLLRYFPRCILADEVGLGKTIEAGIYIKEMLARHLASKILIIVQASLIEQWIYEFTSKFSINLKKVDGKLAPNLGIDRSGMFYDRRTGERFPYIICSLQLARKDKYRELLAAVDWDIVVFDEAHHLRRYMTSNGNVRETLAYRLARKLSARCRSMLLLTATPIQLHSFDLFSLLQLLRPDIFNDYFEFEKERKKIPIINMLIGNIMNYGNLNTFQRENTVTMLAELFSEPPYVDRNLAVFYDALNGYGTDPNDYLDVAAGELRDALEDYPAASDSKWRNSEVIPHRILDDAVGFLRKVLRPVKPRLDAEQIDEMLRTVSGRKKLIGLLYSYHFLSKFMFRNRKRIIFPHAVRRIVKDIPVVPTKEELELYRDIRRYLAKIYNRAMRNNFFVFGFITVILQKLSVSSHRALLVSLKRKIESIKRDIAENEAILNDPDLLYGEDDPEIMDIDLESSASLPDKEAALKAETEQMKKDLPVLESFMSRLESLKIDSKFTALDELLKDLRRKYGKNLKVIIFTQFRATLSYLRRKLEDRGFIVDVFHGGMTNREKDRSVAHFRDRGEILICTEIGGEGRNFQFCHILINYDLPWNPMRLEQRIGRLDRIGQRKDVYIYNFHITGTIESKIMDVLRKRIDIFKESIGNLEPILSDLEKSIRNAVLNEDTYAAVDKFEKDLERFRSKVDRIETVLNDFVMDVKSFDTSAISDIIGIKEFPVNPGDIKAFMMYFLDIFGDYGKYSAYTAPNGKEIFRFDLSEEFRGIGTDRAEGTFNPDDALMADELELFAPGHPLVDTIIGICRDLPLNMATVLPVNTARLLELIDKGGIENKGDLSASSSGNHVRLSPSEKEFIRDFCSGLCGGFLFIFTVEFSGIVREIIPIPVPVFVKGEKIGILPNLGKILEHPAFLIETVEKDADTIPTAGEVISKLKGGGKAVRKMASFARKFAEKVASSDMPFLSELNGKMYKNEVKRVLSVYIYKRHYLMMKRDSLKRKIDLLSKRRATERKLANLEKIKDPAEKERRMEFFRSVEERLKLLNNELSEVIKAMDDMLFDLPEDLKRLEFYRKLRMKISLTGVAVLYPFLD